MRRIAVLAASFLFGCGSMVEVFDMETELNKLIGKPLPKVNYPRSYAYVEREVDAEAYELVSRRPDQCNYVLLVKRPTDIVVSWRYVTTPPPQGCKFQHVHQLM